MPNQPKTPIRGFRIPDELYLAAKAKAEARGEDMSTVVRAALERYVKRKDIPGTLGGDDDAGEAMEWWTRNRVVALCKRYGHAWEGYSGAEMNGPYSECARCGELAR